VALASTNSPSDSGSTSSTDGQDPSYRGSVIAPSGNDSEGTDSQSSEANESKSLAGLATTKPEQAKAAALAAVPGTAGAAQLENENGYVVYGVEVTGADGKIVDVKVDAGNGTVLAQEAADGTDGAGNGANDSEANDSESNDSETNDSETNDTPNQ
jgi:hypothetical protein